jgi:hypothetical protein
MHHEVVRKLKELSRMLTVAIQGRSDQSDEDIEADEDNDDDMLDMMLSGNVEVHANL